MMNTPTACESSRFIDQHLRTQTTTGAAPESRPDSRYRVDTPDGKDRSPGGRIASLDGLRGIAALGVLLYHFTTRYQDFAAFHGDVPLTFPFGKYGVQLFFVISGFVIFMTVERSQRPFDFLRSRFVRLYPAFWLSLLVAFLLHGTVPGPTVPLSWSQLFERTAINFTMVPRWFEVEVINGVYWTLSIEMTFYAIIFVLLACKRIDWTVPVLTGVVAFVVLDRLVALRWPNPVTLWLRSGLGLEHMNVMLLGVLAYKMRQGPRLAYLGIGLLCLVPFCRFHGMNLGPIIDAALTAAFAVVVYLATTGRLRALEWRPLVFLGTISYSLYLNHEIMGYRIIFHAQRLGLSPIASIVLATLTAVLVAVAITYRFERPVTAALNRRLRELPGAFLARASAHVGTRVYDDRPLAPARGL